MAGLAVVAVWGWVPQQDTLLVVVLGGQVGMSGVQGETAPTADNAGGGLVQAAEFTLLGHRVEGDGCHDLAAEVGQGEYYPTGHQIYGLGF